MSATRYGHRRVAALWMRSRPVAALSAVAVHLRLTRARLALIVVVLAVFAGCFWLWFRDSPFVSVSQVKIVGLSGPDVPQIRQALRTAVVRMSTLDIDIGKLRAAVEPYPDVRTLTVETQLPHAVVIRVDEQVPVARVDLGGTTLAVSSDGMLLQPSRSDGQLPTITAGQAQAGSHLAGAGAEAALAVLSAAPYTLLARIESAADSGGDVVVQLRRGPQLRFGDSSQLRAKWAAALAVLGSASSQGAAYIDLTDPQRPAAGAPTGTSGSSGSSSSTTGTTGVATTATDSGGG